MTTGFDYDDPDFPPLGDADAPTPTGRPSSDAQAIAISLNRLAAAVDRVAQALSVSPGGAPASAPAPSPGPPSGVPSAPPGGQSDDTRIKMSKKVFAICASNKWDIADIGLRATGRNLGADSRKWSREDLIVVLNAFQEWGVG